MVVKVNFHGGKYQFLRRVTLSFDWLAFAVKLEGVKNQFPRC